MTYPSTSKFYFFLAFSIAVLGTLAGDVQAQLPSAVKVSHPASDGIDLLKGKENYLQNVKAPYRYGDKLYFTASVPNKRGTSKVARLFSSVHGDKPIMLPINPKEDNIHAAHATISIGGDRIYYTVFKETTKVTEGHSEIWYRDKEYDGTWGHLVQMPKFVNLSDVINTQPSAGFDFTLKKEVVYFSSNRPGGKGGFDIWFCTVERDGSFGKPVNLPFNTAADEVTPHYSTFLQMVFFSSNMPGGYGGFDVYRSSKDSKGTWQTGENLSSVNTAFDETFFSYHQPSLTCYFCSNMPSFKCHNDPNGCAENAIYAGKLNGSLVVETRSELDSMPLYGCNIELENMETGTIENTILQSENSVIDLPLEPNRKYRLIISRPYHYPVFLPLENVLCDFAHPLRKTIYLKPMR